MAQQSFLPPLTTPKGNMVPTMIPNTQTNRHAQLITGHSFLNTEQHQTNTKGSGFFRGSRASLHGRSLSIHQMSAAEVVRLGSKATNNQFGLENYEIPKSGSPSKIKSSIVPKSKAPGPIEQEAKYRKNFPGAGHYTIPDQLPWDEKSKKVNADFSKADRITEADRIIADSKKPERSSPGPVAYKYEKLKFLPSLKNGVSGGAGLQG